MTRFTGGSVARGSRSRLRPTLNSTTVNRESATSTTRPAVTAHALPPDARSACRRYAPATLQRREKRPAVRLDRARVPIARLTQPRATHPWEPPSDPPSRARTRTPRKRSGHERGGEEEGSGTSLN
jgi:hypothetical protein